MIISLFFTRKMLYKSLLILKSRLYIKELIFLVYQYISSMEAFEVPNNIKLVNHTALAFTVEIDNQQIQAIREKFDPAFQRWQPHINFCFPFVDIPQFQNTYLVLQERLKNFAPFEISFKAMDCFPHGTVFLVP